MATVPSRGMLGDDVGCIIRVSVARGSGPVQHTVDRVQVVTMSLQLPQAGPLLHAAGHTVTGGKTRGSAAGDSYTWSQAEDCWQVSANGKVCHQKS